MTTLSRPPRVSMVNLVDNTKFDFLVNPHQVQETISSSYDRISPYGLSHQIMQYKGTTNLKIPIELYHSTSLLKRYTLGITTTTIQDMRKWLVSLQFPSASQEYSRKSPPEVLFIWPNMWRMKSRVIDYNAQHDEFDDSMASIRFVARITLESVLDRRKLMEEVKSQGTIWSEETI